MNSNTPQTSPSSNGATASATADSLSPKHLTDEFHEQLQVPRLESPSVQPKHAFPVSTIDTPVAVVDDSDRNQRRNTLLESAMGLKRGNDDAKFSFYRLIIGSMFAYVVLGIWIWTVCQYIHDIDRHGCTDAYTGLKDKLAAELTPGFVDAVSDTTSCLELFTGTLACAHSITFGLISAVVLHETSSEDETANGRLSSMIQPIKKRQDVNAHFLQRCVCSLITSLPAIYILSWTILGLTCFIYSLLRPDGSTGPLFYTGQTWIGLIVKATYSFFGVEPDDKVSTPGTAAGPGRDKVEV